MTWTRQRLFATALIIFLGQVAAIFALHTRAPFLVKLPPFPAVRRAEATPSTIKPELNSFTDPMIFAGAHTAGFSRFAWLGRASIDFDLSNSVPPPTFLAYQRAPALEITSNTPPPQKTALPLFQFATANDTSRKSRLVLEGSLANRRLATNPTIPIQFAADVLSNSVVQVAIQSDGFPLFKRLITSSGSRGADLQALEIAENIRFAPRLDSDIPSDDTPGPIQWGQLVFQWFTTEPPTTNAPAAPPK